MNFEKVTFERTRKQDAGYWATIRDGDGKALMFLAVRGRNSQYSRSEVGTILNGIISAVEEGRFERKDLVK